MNKHAGTSMVEVIVYMGLLTLIMGSSVLILFQIIEGDARREQAVLIEEEAQFMMEKIDASLPRGTIVTAPVAGAHGGVLTVSMPKIFHEPISFFRYGAQLIIKRGSSAQKTLNTTSAPLTNLNFEYRASAEKIPAELIVTLFVGNEKFSQKHILLP